MPCHRRARAAVGASSAVLAAASVVVVGLGACGGKDSPSEPGPVLTSIVVTPANPSLPDGQTIQLGVTYRNGQAQSYTPNPIPTVTWSSSAASVASVGPSGMVMGESRGQATITATAAGVSGQTTVTVTPVATQLTDASGSGQSAVVGSELPEPFVVTVRDRHGQPVQGAAVTFAITSGSGTLAQANATSGSDGLVSARLTLGANPGAVTVAATAAGLQGSPVQFTATAQAPPLNCQDVVTVGAGQTIAGELPSVLIIGPVTASADVTICGDLEIRNLNSNFTLGGREVVVEGSLSLVNQGALTMTNAADRLVVGGNAFFSGTSTLGRLTAGEMRLAGNLSVGLGDFTGPTFASTGTLVVLNGTAVQSVSFSAPGADGPGAQRFHDLRITSSVGVTLASNVQVNRDLELAPGAVVIGSDTLTVVGDLTSATGSSLSGSVAIGGALSVAGSYAAFLTDFFGQNQSIPVLPYQHMRVRGTATPAGNLAITGNLEIRNLNSNFTLGGREVVVEGNLSLVNQGAVTMTNTADRLVVGGNAFFSGTSTLGRLTAGEMRLAGNLSVGLGDFTGSTFASTGTLVVLNGTAVQSVSFSAPGADGPGAQRFHDLRITSSVGVTLASNVQVNGALDLVRRLTVPAGRTLTVAGTLTLRGTAELVNSGTVTVGSCIKEAGHTITGTDPCP